MGDGVSSYRKLLVFFRPYLSRFFVAVAAMIVYSAASGGTALLVKNVLDDVFIARDAAMLKVVPLLVILVYLVKGVAAYVHTYLMKYIGQSVIRDLRDRIFDHIMTLPVGFFASRPSGSIMSRFLNDVTLIQVAVTGTIASALRDPITIIMLTGVLLYRNWVLAIIALLVFPVAIYPLAKFGSAFRRISRKSQAKVSRISTLIHEALGGIKIVKAFGMEDYEKERFHEENQRLFALFMKTKRIESISPPLMEFLGSVGMAAVILLGGFQVIGGRMSTGEFFSFMTALLMLYDPVKKLTKVNNATQEALAAADRIFEILDTRNTITDKPGAVVLRRASGRVSFRDVWFDYGKQEVLSGISLDVEPGEVVAFVGSSGVGKSTLVSLIPRFYDVTRGSIAIDGHDVRDVTLASLRAQIAMVTQETILFNDTVMSNIAYGRRDATEEEVREAARAAYAHDFVSALPDGYQTVAGERGVNLSGGERQRLCIARAILANTPMLILDEATSALDAESEMLVQKALQNLMKDRTTFVIAHRLGTVTNADRIVVMEGGHVADVGTHAQLLDSSPVYQRLYRLQFRPEGAAAGVTEEAGG